jgi:hypothetical protein
MMTGRRKTLGPCTHTLAPVFDAGEAQTYQGTDSTGAPLTRVELLNFDWFSDEGTMQSATTRQQNPMGVSLRPTGDLSNTWDEPTSKTDGATFWVVVRDSRGGESWLRRTLVFP